MKPVKNNKLNIDRKTIAKLDQSAMASLNGGGAAAEQEVDNAGTTATFWTVTSLIPTTQTTTATTVTTIY
ncbi:class I lanthipeptide [Pedobacter sp. AW1-32]|uniref:class I lanthipeptide n=1 Tax=Pedobacter sp. AW1-32 TaxID=3383026 RepID=UPI003FEDE456